MLKKIDYGIDGEHLGVSKILSEVKGSTVRSVKRQKLEHEKKCHNITSQLVKTVSSTLLVSRGRIGLILSFRGNNGSNLNLQLSLEDPFKMLL